MAQVSTKIMTINYTETSSSAITDLTGTKWLLNSSFSAISSPTYYINKYNTYYGEGYSTPFYKVNFTCNNVNYYGLGTNTYEGTGTSFPKSSLLHNQFEFITSSTSSAFFSLANKTQYQSYSSQASFNGWPATTPSSSVISSNPIIITGGEDVTNANLITWLQSNATQVTTANVYEISQTLSGLSHGNMTIQITPSSGYTYPSSLTVTNGTLVSYNSSTGVAVISGDDTTTVSGECSSAPTPALISFTIGGGDVYEAEEGMTWTQWCESNYNTDGYFSDGYTIVAPTYEYAVAYNNIFVSSTDVIVENREYTLKHYGG